MSDISEAKSRASMFSVVSDRWQQHHYKTSLLRFCAEEPDLVKSSLNSSDCSVDLISFALILEATQPAGRTLGSVDRMSEEADSVLVAMPRTTGQSPASTLSCKRFLLYTARVSRTVASLVPNVVPLL